MTGIPCVDWSLTGLVLLALSHSLYHSQATGHN